VELMMQLSYEEPLLLGKVNEEWLAFVKEYGAHIEVHEEDASFIANNTISVLGLNIYSPERVKCPTYQRNSEAPITFDSFSELYIMHGRQMNTDRGWEIYPKCLYDTLILMKEKYGNPEMRITENGYSG
jgi:6-phospho-beta-glucosidase